MDNPLVSVVVPVYKNPDWVKKAMDSLMEQSYRNLEILVVDDGSPDGCGHLADELASVDRRIRVFHRKNAGVSSARNVALDAVTGQFVTFLDSDDALEPDHIESMVNTALKENADIVSNRMFFYLDDTVYRKASPSDEIRVISSKEAVMMMHSENEIFNGYLMNKLFFFETIQNIRFDPSIAIHEDMLFIWQAVLNAKKIVSRGKYTYHYLMHPGSAINSAYSPRYDTALVASERILQWMERYFPEQIAYGKKTVVFALLSIANKRYAALCLDRSSWKELRKKLRMYHDQAAFRLIVGLDNRISYVCMLLGRPWFVFWKKIVRFIKK